MSCRPLGVSVESWDRDGHPLYGTDGELVAPKPMPSTPVFFWGTMVDPADIAALVLFLTGPHGRSISGQMLPIDGDSKAAS